MWIDFYACGNDLYQFYLQRSERSVTDHSSYRDIIQSSKNGDTCIFVLLPEYAWFAERSKSHLSWSSDERTLQLSFSTVIGIHYHVWMNFAISMSFFDHAFCVYCCRFGFSLIGPSTMDAISAITSSNTSFLKIRDGFVVTPQITYPCHLLFNILYIAVSIKFHCLSSLKSSSICYNSDYIDSGNRSIPKMYLVIICRTNNIIINEKLLLTLVLPFIVNFITNLLFVLIFFFRFGYPVVPASRSVSYSHDRYTGSNAAYGSLGFDLFMMISQASLPL